MLAKQQINLGTGRWNNYKACHKKSVNNEAYTQLFFHQYFLGNGHNGLISDCEIVLIDKTDPAEPTADVRHCFG